MKINGGTSATPILRSIIAAIAKIHAARTRITNRRFQSIIVAVVGGVLLGGGYGSAFGVFLGTMIYGIINVGIFYTGWSTDWVQLFLGVLLLCAVLANLYFRRFAMSAR